MAAAPLTSRSLKSQHIFDKWRGTAAGDDVANPSDACSLMPSNSFESGRTSLVSGDRERRLPAPPQHMEYTWRDLKTDN
ncbi:hypothetical protein BDZ97DRAFT_1866133 [Flammula alnicola]|nr:hypothetical protein BDZ97DRAFT_1866133 [Flammula alnicola]